MARDDVFNWSDFHTVPSSTCTRVECSLASRCCLVSEEMNTLILPTLRATIAKDVCGGFSQASPELLQPCYPTSLPKTRHHVVESLVQLLSHDLCPHCNSTIPVSRMQGASIRDCPPPDGLLHF